MKTNKNKKELIEKGIQNNGKKKLVVSRSSIVLNKKSNINKYNLIYPLLCMFSVGLVLYFFNLDLFINLFICLFLGGFLFVFFNKSLFFNSNLKRQVIIENKDISSLIKKHELILSNELLSCLKSIDLKLTHFKSSNYKYIFNINELHLIDSIEKKHIADILNDLSNCDSEVLVDIQLVALKQLESFDEKLNLFLEQETNEIESKINMKNIYIK